MIISERNGEGKSSLIKSIQYCLGSNLKAFPKGWDYKNYVFQLEIVIDKNKILIQRYNNIITVLDDGKIKKFGYLKDYSDWFQDKMEMNLKLVSKNKNTSSLASLEAILSPLYIDQDKSWDGILYKNSFEGLAQYKSQSFPKEVFEYYLGISNNIMNDKINKLNKYREKSKEKKVKIEQVDSVYKNYSSQKNISKTIPKEFEEFKKQVDFYIKETDRFSQMITQKTDKLSKEKMKLDILQQDREELRKLLTKTKKRLSEVSYECTYCHSVLTRGQSLTRMELDDNKIEILLRKDSINQEIIKIENNIQKKLIEIQNLENQFELYHERLSELKQLSNIDNYVNQKVLQELETLKIEEVIELKEIDQEIKSLRNEISKLKKSLKTDLENINQKFKKLKNKISLQMETTGLSEKKVLNFNKLNGSGTFLNKDLLTLYLVYMNLLDSMEDFGLPFAIDSFVKNETDSIALEKMFGAIDKYFLTLNNQTFFSIIKENLKFIENPVNEIKIERPLLKEKFFSDIEKELIQNLNIL
ncbi:endonuclease [Staphylococcus aureus]|uniref:endonuclease n=2 Tax=Staphylococcus aureus TaxID=1280 RepID=UPI0007CA669F|nr:endonuclease [Staphylococcus aureus]MDV0305713.1 endonuclease [Staphylococcus aureus]SBA53044.1 Uncharacterised protein [Staphylococcus aureus]SGU23906.1 Uncharacterised protein [Staphylococcus aureus]